MTMITRFMPGELWPDRHGTPINAHGGGILRHADRWWWFGEHKTAGTDGNFAQVGIHVYSSSDLLNWQDEGIALQVAPQGSQSPIEQGSIIERPKVLYDAVNRRFVMYFHLEPVRAGGYSAALTGIAVARRIAGPYQLVKAIRPNAGYWPQNVRPQDQDPAGIDAARSYREKIPNCNNPVTPALNILGRDRDSGQQTRDMTLFRDDDGTAYHIYSSEHNATLHIAELTDDLLDYTGRYWRIFEHRWMEAPVLFKHRGRYFLIASDCTGWTPNAARLAMAECLGGPWTELGNPVRGTAEQQQTTFNSQGTFALQLDDDRVIFMADRWNPDNAIDGRYVWLPIRFDHDIPYLEWQDCWTLEKYTFGPRAAQVNRAYVGQPSALLPN